MHCVEHMHLPEKEWTWQLDSRCHLIDAAKYSTRDKRQGHTL